MGHRLLYAPCFTTDSSDLSAPAISFSSTTLTTPSSIPSVWAPSRRTNTCHA